MNLNDRPRVAASMAKAVRLVYRERLYTAALCLIAAYIDGLAGGSEESTRKRRRLYLQFLEEHFLELCQQIGGAQVFYEKYRHGMLHEFSPKRGFALAENGEVDGAYVADLEVDGVGKLRGLNMDRLVEDFLKVADAIGKGADPEGEGRE